MGASIGNINPHRSVSTSKPNDLSPVDKAGAARSASQAANPKQLLASLLVEADLEQRIPIQRWRPPQQTSTPTAGADAQAPSPPITPGNVVMLERMTAALNEHLGD